MEEQFLSDRLLVTCVSVLKIAFVNRKGIWVFNSVK
jgi:hypothetical protein